MSEKEKLIEYINNYYESSETTARNRMGCSEKWYNSYYAMKNTFSIDEINAMNESEILNLLKLAENIQEALF